MRIAAYGNALAVDISHARRDSCRHMDDSIGLRARFRKRRAEVLSLRSLDSTSQLHVFGPDLGRESLSLQNSPADTNAILTHSEFCPIDVAQYQKCGRRRL